MRRWRAVLSVRIALVCLATACGRLEFDGTTFDAAVDASDVVLANHDEDGDGLDDAIDACPHMNNAGTDLDGDALDDACDPNPMTGGDMIVVFSTLQLGDHPFDSIANSMQLADGLRWVGNHGATLTYPFSAGRIEFGFEILALEANPQKQLALGIEGTGVPYYFTELNDNAGATYLGVVSYDGTNGYVTRSMTPHAGVHTGPGRYQLDVTAGTSPAYRVRAGWIGEVYDTMAAIPGYTAPGTSLRFVFNGLDVRIDYVVVIASP